MNHKSERLQLNSMARGDLEPQDRAAQKTGSQLMAEGEETTDHIFRVQPHFVNPYN